MNEDILYQQYLSNNTESPISIEEFTSLKSIMSPEDFDNFVGLKKRKFTGNTKQFIRLRRKSAYNNLS